MTDFRPVIRIAPNNQVFDLPVIVGIEEGLFEAAGLDVKFSATHADREKDAVGGAIMARLKENLFDCGSADSYNVCEWASIDRLERGSRGGNIAALRAAVAAQAILSFDDALAGAARSRRRPGRGAGAHRLALHAPCRCSRARSAPTTSTSTTAACRRCAGPASRTAAIAPSP